jgi:hypothetical protein
MSREFGEYHAPGYFHRKLENAAEDARGGEWGPTQLMEPALSALARAAYVCASIEACDWSPSPKRTGEWLAAMVAARDAIDRATLEAHKHIGASAKERPCPNHSELPDS